MSLERYKSLLTAIAAALGKIGDKNGERLYLRWLRAAEELDAAPQPNLSLMNQAREVIRSARAIVILATERYLSPTALASPRNLNLECTLNELLAEANGIKETLENVAKLLADRGLSELVNESLNGVDFFMDYVRLQFGHSSVLASLTLPEVREPEALYTPNDIGYRDALCRRIGGIVRHVELREAQEITISFSDDSEVRVSLRLEDSMGGESAIFSSATGGLWVW